jgi:potassium efflux system protein
MPILLRYFSLWLIAMAISLPLYAQDTAPSSDDTSASDTPPAPTADQLDNQLDQITKAIAGKLDDAGLADTRGKVLVIQQQADQLGAALMPQSDNLKAKLLVLGPAPEKGAPAEAPEVREQRRELTKAKADLDAQVKQIALISQEAARLSTQIASMRRDEFETKLASRTATPLSGEFWSALSRNIDDDNARLGDLGRSVGSALAQAWQPANRGALLGYLIAALLLASLGRRLLERALLKLSSIKMPSGRLRRSAMALAVALISALTIGLAAELAYLAINAHDLLDADLQTLAKALVKLAWFCAFLAGLGRGLLSVARPSWRLPNLSDDAAEQLRPFPWLLAAATAIFVLIERINSSIGASLTIGVATNGLNALIISGLVAALLFRLGRARRTLLAAGEEPAKRPLWVGLLVGAAFVTVALCWLGVITGYIAFAYFLARQMMWTGLVVCTLYLLLHVVDDVLEALFNPQGRSGQRMQEAFGVASNRLEQTATVLSGVLRCALLLLALSFVVMPFHTDPSDILNRTTQIFTAQSLGNLKIAPASLAQGILVFVLGLLIVRLVKSWLTDQLLPRTELDLGMKNSITTLFGYVGGVLAMLLALATAEVSLQSIAWIASALSVGIGFGLQAIVQNFISGLILLAERPVKVGDWVSIGDVEGDVRRINVRATEIQLGDRSTVIVPNSQLITQNVRNVTLANALGRVQIKLPMPLDTDASKTRQLVMTAFDQHASVLDNPAPSVTLDQLDASGMVFVATGYVRSPRDAGHTKSDLLFEILQRLRDAGLSMSSPQAMVIHRRSRAKAGAASVMPKALLPAVSAAQKDAASGDSTPSAGNEHTPHPKPHR